MGTLMCIEHPPGCRRIRAKAALVRPLACVLPLVDDQLVHVLGGVVTLVALVGLLSCVHAHVAYEDAFVLCREGTEVALVEGSRLAR